MTRPKRAFCPPMRDGVGASSVYVPAGPWPLLVDFLCQRFPRIERSDWLARLAAGEVLDAQGLPISPNERLPTQQVVYYYRSPPPEINIPFEEKVLYQDAHLLVADKPHFLPVLPSGRYVQETLLVRLKRKLGLADLVPLHRIDRDTAGLVMFSVNPLSRGAFAALFRQRQMDKRYEAIAPWRADLALPMTLRNRIVPSEMFMRMQVVAGEANSQTDIAVLERSGRWARYALSPLTGRRHQLRVQMADLGLPILHDQIYPSLSPECPIGQVPDYSQPLQLLARSLVFVDPISGEARRFESQLRLTMPPAEGEEGI